MATAMLSNTSDLYLDHPGTHHNILYDNMNYGNINDNVNYDNYGYSDSDYGSSELANVSPVLMELTRCLSLYIQPILCVFGIAGHSLSFVIFMSKSMRKISSNIYLAALSGSSVGFNLVLLLQWLEMVNVQLIHKTGFCQGIVYFGYVFSFLSIWFIVCITIENYIVTFHLSRAVTFCSVIRAKVIVTILAICSIAMYLGQFWTTKVIDFGDGAVICTEVEEYRALNRVYFFWDTVVTLLIPSLVTTGLILAILTRNVCLRHDKTNQRLSKKQRSLVRITRVLLAISLTFVILSAPSHANKLRHLIITEVFGRQLYSLEDRILQQLFQVIYYLSFCLNFVYYLIWSINFRKEFKRLFGCREQSRRRRRFELLNANVQMIGNLSGNHTEKITIL